MVFIFLSCKDAMEWEHSSNSGVRKSLVFTVVTQRKQRIELPRKLSFLRMWGPSGFIFLLFITPNEDL